MKILSVLFFLASVLSSGCVFARHSVHVEPVEVEPIHLTVDVNIDVKDSSAEYEADDEVDAGPGHPPPPPYRYE